MSRAGTNIHHPRELSEKTRITRERHHLCSNRSLPVFLSAAVTPVLSRDRAPQSLLWCTRGVRNTNRRLGIGGRRVPAHACLSASDEHRLTRPALVSVYAFASWRAPSLPRHLLSLYRRSRLDFTNSSWQSLTHTRLSQICVRPIADTWTPTCEVVSRRPPAQRPGQRILHRI